MKKNDNLGANESTSSPRSSAHSTYVKPSFSVNASSCAAVEPASRMWYPEIEIGCQSGISAAQNSTMSVTSRIDGPGGKMNSFCAMYSFRMSVWIVPRSRSRGTPCSSPTTRYIASAIAADELIVIDVDTSPSGIPENSTRMSSSDATATPSRPTSPTARGESESTPISAGMSNAHDNPVCPCSSRYRNRSFVSAAVPNPANCRIVQSRPRYIDGYTPRVNGNDPG